MCYNRQSCLTLLTVAFVCGLLGSVSLTVIAEESSSGLDTGSRQVSHPSFRLRHARAFLKSTEVELKLAESTNKRVPNVIPETQMETYREKVKVAKRFLKAAEEENSGSDFIVFVRLAKAAYNIAIDDWRRAKQLHDRIPTDHSKLDAERLRLRSEMALVTFEQGQSLANASAEEQSQWKIFLLYNEVLRLRRQVAQLSHGGSR